MTTFLDNAAAAQDAGRDAAYAAARWALDVPDDNERRRLFDGHRARRIPIERAGLPATDFTAADEWLISEHRCAIFQEWRGDARDITGCYCPSDCGCKRNGAAAPCGCTGNHGAAE